MSDTPPIPFRYRMTEPDQPVLIHEGGGAVALPDGSERLQGDLRVVLDWAKTSSPRPGWSSQRGQPPFRTASVRRASTDSLRTTYFGCW